MSSALSPPETLAPAEPVSLPPAASTDQSPTYDDFFDDYSDQAEESSGDEEDGGHASPPRPASPVGPSRGEMRGLLSRAAGGTATHMAAAASSSSVMAIISDMTSDARSPPITPLPFTLCTASAAADSNKRKREPSPPHRDTRRRSDHEDSSTVRAVSSRIAARRQDPCSRPRVGYICSCEHILPTRVGYICSCEGCFPSHENFLIKGPGFSTTPRTFVPIPGRR